MSEMKECTICKHYGKKTIEPKKLEPAVIFDEIGNPVQLVMCRKHSVELWVKKTFSFPILGF